MCELDTAKKFQFIAGNLALDFCNTVGGKRGVVEREYLSSPIQYLAWCEQAGILSREQAKACLLRASRQPEETALVLERGVQLREAIFRTFAAQMGKQKTATADLSVINNELSQGLGRLRISSTHEQKEFEWRWFIEGDALDQALGPVAHAAATLLVDPHRVSHVRMCNGDTCGWVFIDSSKNHSRCWCDMRDCGNRAKIRRHRLKKRNANAT